MTLKPRRFHLFFLLIFSTGLLLGSCSSDDDNVENPEEGDGDCYIKLFDGDNFKDDHITVEGPAEYTDLSNLPNADDKDWTDEADSFKISKGASVTVWSETEFKGDSTVYEAGDYPSVDEPYSLKITCIDNSDDE